MGVWVCGCVGVGVWVCGCVWGGGGCGCVGVGVLCVCVCCGCGGGGGACVWVCTQSNVWSGLNWVYKVFESVINQPLTV